MKINIDQIDVGIPKFQWLLGRLDTESFKERDPKVYKALMETYGSKKNLLNFLETRYETYLDMPILVEETEDGYKIRDGRRRLVVLLKKGVEKVEAELAYEGMTKADWEGGKLLEILHQKIRKGEFIDPYYPQKKDVHGEAPFNLYLKNDPVTTFMISTGIQVPYVLKRADQPICRGDEFKKPWNAGVEFLVGNEKHEPIMEKWGSQPLSSYLVGHFATKGGLVDAYGPYVIIQQYFRAGYWGLDLKGWEHNGKPTVKEQIAQNNIGIPLLFGLGILKEGTNIYFADQSADKPGALQDYFRLFKGLQEYYRWLPTYLRKCRANHFNIPIEEVIKCIPT